jgi:hypothetical protein
VCRALRSHEQMFASIARGVKSRMSLPEERPRLQGLRRWS